MCTLFPLLTLHEVQVLLFYFHIIFWATSQTFPPLNFANSSRNPKTYPKISISSLAIKSSPSSTLFHPSFKFCIITLTYIVYSFFNSHKCIDICMQFSNTNSFPVIIFILRSANYILFPSLHQRKLYPLLLTLPIKSNTSHILYLALKAQELTFHLSMNYVQWFISYFPFTPNIKLGS